MTSSNFKSFETERLLLLPTSADDADFIFELMNTDSWLKYIGDRNIHSIADAEAYIKNKIISQFEKLGYGNYTIVRKSDQTKLGSCGLYDRDGVDGIDIGFALLPQFEGMGYAYEASCKIKEVGFYLFNISEIKAITAKGNIASQKLLTKLGLGYEGILNLPNDNEELLLYKISKPE